MSTTDKKITEVGNQDRETNFDSSNYVGTQFSGGAERSFFRGRATSPKLDEIEKIRSARVSAPVEKAKRGQKIAAGTERASFAKELGTRLKSMQGELGSLGWYSALEMFKANWARAFDELRYARTESDFISTIMLIDEVVSRKSVTLPSLTVAEQIMNRAYRAKVYSFEDHTKAERELFEVGEYGLPELKMTFDDKDEQ